MSIRDQISACVQAGRLFYVLPEIRTVSIQRHLFVSEEVWTFIETGTWETEDWEDRSGHLKADLDIFILGQPVTACLTPYNAAKKNAILAILDPAFDGVWDIRSLKSPQLRVFGAFAEKDIFVALNWATRASLGGPGSREWRDERERCKAIWRQLFPAHNPLLGDHIHEFISQNVTLV